MWRLALRHCLGYLASRIPSSRVTLAGFMREFVLYPVSLPVAYAMAARHDDARVLVVAFDSVAKVAVFSSHPRIIALVLGNSVRAWGILALAPLLPWLLW